VTVLAHVKGDVLLIMRRAVRAPLSKVLGHSGVRVARRRNVGE